MNDPLALARPEIRTLAAYEHASWENGFERLHANELPWRAATDGTVAGLNRYPEPHPAALAARLADLYVDLVMFLYRRKRPHKHYSK